MRMTLEMTLVQTQNMYGSFYEALDRSRVIIENGDEDAMPKILEFISKNIDYIDSFISDKATVARIRNLSSIDVTELACLRYMLGTYGLDILCYVVSDEEDNANEVPAGVVEYNIIDSKDFMTPSIPFVTKVTMDADRVSLSELYKKVNEMYSLFEGDLFADFGNPVVQYSNVLEASEEMTGKVLASVTNQINNIFNYLGLNIIVITNSDPVRL